MTTNWSDVKNDPTLRIVYHNDNFQELVKSADELSKELLNVDKPTAQALRLVLDGMVKCFDQFYYDVNSGFPGYRPAIWKKINSDTVKAELSLAEITMIEEALDYAYEQVHDSFIPVFDAFSHTERVYVPEEDTMVEYRAELTEEEIDGVDDAIADIKANLALLYPHDGGIIEVNA